MKLFTPINPIALVALLASPAMASPWAASCQGEISGHLQINGQVMCVRRMSEAEIQANAAAAREQEFAAMRRQHQSARNISRRNVNRLEDQMDQARENISAPGGARAYRHAIDNWANASAHHNINFER